MITLFIFTEEPSIKEVLDVVIPKISPDLNFQIFPHQGKNDLENALRKTVPNISKIPNARIIIVRDQDDLDCKELKKSLISIIENNIYCPYKVRIVCKELESWFLGDLSALEKTFPTFKSARIATKREMRNVDDIQKPSKYILKVIPEYANKNYLPKINTAKIIAPNLSIDNNNSLSFKNMVNAIRKLNG